MNTKKRIAIITAGILIPVVLSLVLFFTLSPLPVKPEQALALYGSAVTSLSERDIVYTIQTVNEIQQLHDGGNTLNEHRAQTVHYQNRNTPDFCGSVTEELKIGSFAIRSTEIYSGETGYFTVADQHFTGPMTQEGYLSRYAPVNLIQPELYQTVSAQRDGGVCTIAFSEATAIEGWIPAENADFISGEGTAVIAKDGSLQSCRYQCRYTLNNTRYILTVTAVPQTGASAVTVPTDLSAYTPLSDPAAPKALEIACGYLSEVTAFQSDYRDRIYCQAFEDTRNQTITLVAADDPEPHAQVTTDITLRHGNTGTDTRILKEETFQSGQYTISIDSGNPTMDPQVDSAGMLEYCHNILVGTIMLPEHIASVDVNRFENQITYHFEGNEAFIDQIRADACQALYQDPDVLTNQTRSHTAQSAAFFLTTDSATGMPLRSGFTYAGSYATNELPYLLEFSAAQDYTLQ